TSVADFNVFRNHNYIYNIYINGVNDIVVEVDANYDLDPSGRLNEPEPGATGKVVVALEEVYTCDSHYSSHVISFHAKNLDPDNISWYVETPFNPDGAEPTVVDGYEYTDGIDFEWVEFRVNEMGSDGLYKQNRQPYKPRTPEFSAYQTMNITELVIKTAPLGVFGLIAAQIGEIGGGAGELARLGGSLGLYTLTVISGLGFHMLVTMSVILFLFRLRPAAHLRKMFLTLITGFSTATSNATIPVSLKLLEEEEGVSKETASFIVPLGATVNMNGTSLYECVVVLFLAQAHGMEMNFVQMVTIVLTALLSAIGTAGIPMASLVMITIILGAVGLSLDGLGLILIVDRFLDMLRTVVNVYGDTCCAVCVAKTDGERLTIDRAVRK
ncbi:MAG: dicarboxylate/amino acid:cation symporter, partial [Thermoguttaceae bacterium]|nr:dicarboxylate/amino acid:cation symporter [Thermoguttaceae bacterium]